MSEPFDSYQESLPVRCPLCGTTLIASGKIAGEAVRCPGCKEVIAISANLSRQNPTANLEASQRPIPPPQPSGTPSEIPAPPLPPPAPPGLQQLSPTRIDQSIPGKEVSELAAPPLPNKLPDNQTSPDASRCPQCGFSHKYDGEKYGHCGHGAASFYYKLMGEEHGPVLKAHLVELALSGTISPETFVRYEGDDNWFSADRLKGLFPEISVAVPPPPPPPLSEKKSPQENAQAVFVVLDFIGGVFLLGVYRADVLPWWQCMGIAVAFVIVQFFIVGLFPGPSENPSTSESESNEQS